MEALNAVGLTTLSVLPKRTKPTNAWSLCTGSHFKNQAFPNSMNSGGTKWSIPKTVNAGLGLLSSVLGSGMAQALTYEEALEQSVSSSGSDFDVAGVIEGFTTFVAENPLIIGGGVAVLAVPLIVSQLLGKSQPWGVISARNAYNKLGEDANAQLLDIRASGDIRQDGSPDLTGLKKKPVAVVYRGEDKPGFLAKLALRLKEPESTTLIILDKFDGNSELVAELVTANGFKAAYAVKDGAEGSRGWKNSGLPWIIPKTGFNLDLSVLTSGLGEGADAVPLVLGVVAATGLGLLAFTEVETLLQLFGSAALVQFVGKKLLFAEDRKQTIQQFEELLNTKVAPKELVGDIQQIGKALLPSPATSKALPAPADVAPATLDGTFQKLESTTELNNVRPEAESDPLPIPKVNSVPKAEVDQSSLPVLPKPLSPYPNYPDYKPPSSPIPSRP